MYTVKNGVVVTHNSYINEIINKNVNKLREVAVKTANDREDLHQQSLLILCTFLHKEGIDPDSEWDLSQHQRLRFRDVLNVRLREYANASKRIMVEGRTYYVDLALKTIHDGEIEEIEEIEKSESYNDFARWFHNNRAVLLTPTDEDFLNVYREMINNDLSNIEAMQILNVAAHTTIGRRRDRIRRKVLKAYADYTGEEYVDVKPVKRSNADIIMGADKETKNLMVTPDGLLIAK